MKIFLSTGGFNQKLSHSINLLKKNNIKNIELSGGKYEIDIFNKIKKNFKNIDISIHNYIPIFKKSFVINFASNDRSIIKDSIKLAKRAIDLVSLNNFKFYTIHAGFLFDPKVNMLGDKPVPKEIFTRSNAIKNFVKNIKILNKYANTKQVKLLIENNVVSRKQYAIYDYVPLMCDIQETKKIMHLLPNNIKMLLDFGHLNVSSNVLGFSRSKYIYQLDNFIDAYHLSDNNGLSDQNKKFNTKSWFWNFIKKNKKFCAVEVYSQDIKQLKQQMKLAKKIISKI